MKVKKFQSAWWCPGAHTQSIFAHFFRPVPANLSLERKHLETPDGDFLKLDFLISQAPEKSPCVLLLHGLEGSSNARYIRSLLGKIQARGGRAVVMNFRGCSKPLEPNRLITTYHSGKTEDLDLVVNHLREKENMKTLFIVGYSIGGNITLKWLGEQGMAAQSKVQKAAAVSVPYNLARSAEMLDRGFNQQVYTRRLLTTLKAKILAKEKKFPSHVNAPIVQNCKTFKVFDREVTARLNGFRDEMDYWTKSSSQGFLEKIRVQTLLVNAEDDPFFPGTFLPRQIFSNSDYLKPLITAGGGHLGFVAGPWPWQQELWLEERIMEFLESPETSAPLPA